MLEIIGNIAARDGIHPTCVRGVDCIKLSNESPRGKQRWRACVGIVVQGGKEILLGSELYRCGAGDYTVTPVDLPVSSRIFAATPNKPFLAMLITFDASMLAEVASQIEPERLAGPTPTLRGLFIGQASSAMMDSAGRLAALLRNAEDGPVLGPLVIREILYHLLRGPDGAAIHQFVRAGSHMHKIYQAIYRMKSAINEDIDVAALVNASHMSRSAFFAHFKQATAMSPIQYQKRLRLLEARRLMADEGETAEASAYKVGYNSASQFSREYSRMFNNSPLRDATKIKEAG